MGEFQLRLTSRMVSIISDIERLSGRFDQPAIARVLDERSGESLVVAELCKLTRADRPTSLLSINSLQGFIASLSPQFDEVHLSRELLEQVQRALDVPAPTLRRDHQSFRAPLESEFRGEELFRNTEPYLIETRLRELLDWYRSDDEKDALHPLLRAALFHLVFLQLAPFQERNHDTALLVLVIALDEHYPWLQSSRFLSILLNRNYFAALKNAEKSVFTNWATTPSWIEYFLSAVLDSAHQLRRELNREFGYQKLTAAQEQIVEIIRTKGGATREVIAEAAGMNPSTVKYNLGVLSSRGVLERLGAGRTTSYRVN